MMNFCVVNPDGIIENVIVCEDEATAKEFGAVPGYEDARIGDIYIAPPPQPTAMDRLEAQVTYTAMMTDTLMEG
jgi:hypothetical protein